MQRPHLIAEWLRMPSGDPELIAEDECGMLVPRFPDHLRRQLGPLLAVTREPGVTPVGFRHARPSAQYPHTLSIDHRREPKPSGPRRGSRHLCPVHPIL